MLCPEGSQIQKDEDINNFEDLEAKHKSIGEGSGSFELKSFKNPKAWKKSFSNFFGIQSRSAKSNDGDGASNVNETFEEKPLSPEQKWQSLGKVFRRQSFVNNWEKTSTAEESTTQSKRPSSVKKAISNYLCKTQKLLQRPAPES